MSQSERQTVGRLLASGRAATPHIVTWVGALDAGTAPLPTHRFNWRLLHQDREGPGRYWLVLMVVAVMQRYGDNRSATLRLRDEHGWNSFDLPTPAGFRFRVSTPPPPENGEFTEGWLQWVEDPENKLVAPFPTMKLRQWLHERFNRKSE